MKLKSKLHVCQLALVASATAVPFKSIKICEASEPITIIINQTFITEIFPDKLKLAKVIPILKQGDDTTMNNYRPISILPAVSSL